jgi:hypothetical protein
MNLIGGVARIELHMHLDPVNRSPGYPSFQVAHAATTSHVPLACCSTVGARPDYLSRYVWCTLLNLGI